MGPVEVERNVPFGLLFGCDPSSGASWETISRVMPFAGRADGAGGAGEAGGSGGVHEGAD
jgi:hypothetical protein